MESQRRYKPIILCRVGLLNKKLEHKIEIVPIFLEKKVNSLRRDANTNVSFRDSVDFLEQMHMDQEEAPKINSSFIYSDFYEEFENPDYNEIIVTVDDGNNEILDDHSEFEHNIEHGQKLKEKVSNDNKDSVLKPNRESFKCIENGCVSEKFLSFRLFRDHYISVHRKFPLECSLCGKRYKEKHSLKNHLEMHSDDEKYPCKVCSKRFRTKERLLVHNQLHQGRRFFCKCGFKARCQKSLLKHKVMKHGERKFGCNFCRKSFASRRNLEAHVRIHTGETPRKCYLCGSKFNRLHHFRQHLSTGMHIKAINNLVVQGGKIPDNLNPEKNVPKKREIVDVHP